MATARPDPDAVPNAGVIGMTQPPSTMQQATDFLKGATKGLDPRVGVEEARKFLGGNPTVAKAVDANYPGLAAGRALGSPSSPGAMPSAESSGDAAPNPYDATFGTMQPGAMGGGLQLSPPRLIAAHFDPSRIPLRESTQQALYGALDNTRTLEAGQDLARVQANAADVSANLLEQEAERARYDRAQRMEAENARQQQVRGMLDRAKQLSEAAQQATVDPKRFYKDPSNVMMAVGAVLRPGNEGMAALERAYERDLALQRGEIDRKRQAGLDAMNTLAEYQKAFGDERAAELAWEADARDVARMKLLAIAERSQSPQIMAQANVVASQLADQRDAKKADLTARFDQMSYVPAQVVGGGAAQQKPLENVVNLPNGVSLQMPSKELQQKAIEKIEYAEIIRSNNNKALQLREEIRKNPLQAPQKMQELKALQDQTVSMLSLARGQGVVKEAEFARAAESAAAYTALTPGSDTTIRASSDNAVRDLGIFMRASGAEQVQRGYTQTPRGIQPTGVYTGFNVTPQAMQDPSSFKLQMPTVKSSIFTKMPVGPASGPAGATFDVMTPGGGMDVMGSLQAHQAFGTRFASDPSGGMMGGGILSSEKAKTKAGFKLEDAGSFVPILGADAGTHQTAEGQSFVVADQPQSMGASLSGPAPQYSTAPARASAAPAAAAKPRAMTPEEMMRAADAMERQQRVEHEARMAMGPSVSPLADAARAQAGEPWAYKPEFRPPNQAPGEVNVGPYAENMARDPIASTAVKPGADGLPELDPQKTLTLNAAINADQQKQIDELAMALAYLRQGRR